MIVSATSMIMMCAKCLVVLFKDIKAKVTPDSVGFHAFVQPGGLCTLKHFKVSWKIAVPCWNYGRQI